MQNPSWNPIPPALRSGIPIGGARLTIGTPFPHPGNVTGPMVNIPITRNVTFSAGGGTNMSTNHSAGIGVQVRF